MNPLLEPVRAYTRRHFFTNTGLGFGAMALNALLQQEAQASLVGNPMAARQAPLPAKAKRVIYLHMAGSPSQIELFENKPALAKFSGQPCPEEYLKGKRFAFIKGVPKMLGPQFKYSQHGQSGQWISELLPQLVSQSHTADSFVREWWSPIPKHWAGRAGRRKAGSSFRDWGARP